MTSQPLDMTRLLVFSSICVMTALVSYSLGLLIAVELSGKPSTARGTVPIAILVPFVLFAGFVMDFYLLPNYIKWLSWISYVRYAFNGKESRFLRKLFNIILQYLQHSIDYAGALIAVYGFGREKLECWNDYCYFRNPQMILNELAIGEDSYVENASALVFVFVALQILTLCLLFRKMRSNR